MARIRVRRRPFTNQPNDNNGQATCSSVQLREAPRRQPGELPVVRSSAYGKYAGIIPSSEQFMREKQHEIAREDGSLRWPGLT
jgi:hypothetical protein